MAVWPYLMGASCVMLGASLLVRNDWAARVGALMLVAYVAVQLKKLIFADSELAYIATAAIWVFVSGAIPRQLGSSLTQNMIKVFAIRVCLAASGLCYLWARVAQAPREFGSAPFLTADLLAIVAMLFVWSELSGDIFDRMRLLGRNVFGGRGRYSYSRVIPDSGDPQ